MARSWFLMMLKSTCGKNYACICIDGKRNTYILTVFSGIYCLLAVATMLNIMTPELVAGVPEFIVSCQTYEGGFGNASFPGWAYSGEYVSTYVRVSMIYSDRSCHSCHP